MHIKFKNIVLWFWALLLSNGPFTNCDTMQYATAKFFSLFTILHHHCCVVLTPKKRIIVTEKRNKSRKTELDDNRWMNKRKRRNEWKGRIRFGRRRWRNLNAHCTLHTANYIWMYLLRLGEKWNNSQKVKLFRLMSHGYHCNAINNNDIMFDLKGFCSLLLLKIKRIEKCEQ